MEFLADEPVRSGQQYPVTDIDGRPPRTLHNFTGDVCLTLIRDEAAVHMLGAGSGGFRGAIPPKGPRTGRQGCSCLDHYGRR